MSFAVSATAGPSNVGGIQTADQFKNWISTQSAATQNNASKLFEYTSTHSEAENQNVLKFFRLLDLNNAIAFVKRAIAELVQSMAASQATEGVALTNAPAPRPEPVAPAPAPAPATEHSHAVGDRSAPLSTWTPQSLQNATFDATRKYFDIEAAKAAGYAPPPWSGYESKPDDPDGDTLHMHKDSLKHDGKVLDPNAPEVLLYHRNGDGTFTLVGAMYVSEKGMATPRVGDVGYFHSHAGRGESHATAQGEQNGMMHMWFAKDVSKAYSMGGVGADGLWDDLRNGTVR